MERLRWLVLVLFAHGLCWSTSRPALGAVPGWRKLMSSRRVEADPHKSYRLTEQQGPWMIFGASFAGEGAEKEAHDLVMELRSRFKLPAYTHKQHYDFSKTVDGNGFNERLEPKRMRHRRNIPFDEVAVLIGDFSSVNDPSLAEVLNRIKYARPNCLELGEGKDTTLRFAGLRALQRRVNGDKQKRQKGPMGSAFVTRNPLLPREYFAPHGADEFVMSMNKGVQYSLLECPGEYSVRVATFRGNVIIDQRRIQEITSGGAMKSRLHDAAYKAHELTLALRRQGVEAYEFHDRRESIVTVGSFQNVGSPRPDGKIEINPTILALINAYGPKRQALPEGGGQNVAGLEPRALAGIPFDVQPIPVRVPRRSVAADYARSPSGPFDGRRGEASRDLR